VECDYKRPVRFEDELEVELIVREKRDRAIRYQFDIRKVGDEAAGLIAQGGFTVVCVHYDPLLGRMTAVQIPQALADQIQVSE
jgi:acyl-CoA thioesterase FadM